ncbi:recombinase family protein [Pantanalinema sp. GBBB05]|uniref:recombinase family protein n=1 Tax=Pantanalinema sp. GBBB05 TaxID=2604139 RepID=UPI001D38840A|nr:recombinase family protein [Pantanalinema sp. GBBB05]
MKVVAYLYYDPLLESTPSPAIWGEWQIEQTYQDIATEIGSKPRSSGDRSQWQQLLQDCEQGDIDAVLVRQLEDLGGAVQVVGDRLAALEKLGVQLIALDQPNVRAELLTLLHQLQYHQRSQRIRQGHARNRVKALPPPGKAPYGYRRGRSGYILDRSTAPVVKEFFEQFLLFGSLRGAVRHLAKKYGKKIAVSTGQRWLTNPTYRGDLAYQTGQLIRDTHMPIISREEAAQVDRLLRRNRQLPSRTASAPRSLAGLVVCSECQSAMTVASVSAPRREQAYLYLRPRTCPKRPKCPAIAYNQILQTTIQRICEDLPRAVAGMDLPDVDQIKQGIAGAIAAKQAVLDQLPTLITNGILDQETVDLRSYKLRTEMAVLETKLAELPPVNLQSIAQAVSIPQFWLDLSESERRFYFREFIRQIELSRNETDVSWQLKLIFIFEF